jgi:hypothetical protein
MIKSAFVLLALVGLTGCTGLAPVAAPLLSSHGSGNAGMQSETLVNLSKDNFIVTRTNVVGISKGFSLLGFIPIYPARVNTALDRLYAKSGIEQGSSKSLAHLTIERTSTYWILFSIPETSIRAQVVEFKSGNVVTN